ncbi:MAG: lytic murein transglycosylase, partial [Patescibacteria group bacterium]
GSSISKQKLLVFVLIGTFSFFTFNFSRADVQQDISERERQIQELERQKEEYQKQITEKQSEARTLEGEIFIFDTEIKKLKLEIKALDLAIQQTGFEIDETIKNIDETLSRIERIKQSLAQFIKLVHQSDQETLLEILLKNRDLSDFFGNLESIRASQEKAQVTIKELKQLRVELEQKQDELEQRKTEQIGLRNIQQIQKKEVDSKKKEKNDILKVTKGEEKKFQELVKKTNQDIERLRGQVRFLLEQGITLEEAIKYGQLAATRVGIRPSFLLAILDVESGIGRNVGTGNWLDDMYNCYLRLGKPTRAETEKNAFFAIIGKLGLDANSVKVSRAPSYGCGGALGPAQFIPSTWLLYESDVARLTGHGLPNPWSIEDAFMAAAIYLSNAGATNQTRAAEIRAANIYLSGKANCRKSVCRYYSNLVLQKAAEIEKDLPQISSGVINSFILSLFE